MFLKKCISRKTRFQADFPLYFTLLLHFCFTNKYWNIFLSYFKFCNICAKEESCFETTYKYFTEKYLKQQKRGVFWCVQYFSSSLISKTRFTFTTFQSFNSSKKIFRISAQFIQEIWCEKCFMKCLSQSLPKMTIYAKNVKIKCKTYSVKQRNRFGSI